MRIEKDGYVFDTESGYAKMINEYIEEKDLSIVCYLAEHDGDKRYILAENGQPVYHSTNAEHVLAHIDWMVLQRDF